MKEIVFIRQGSANMGGVQWQIVKLAEKLFSRGCFKPVLITSNEQSPFAKDFAAHGFEVVTIPMGKLTILSAARKILHILEDRDAAVIQTHLLRESLIGRAVRKKRADIRHIFRAEVYPSSLNPGWKKRLCHLLDGITSRWVDCYIPNGRYLADEIVNRSGVELNKVIVLLNGRDRIGSPDGPCDKPNEPLPARIAMVANLAHGKGHDCLIKALALLKRRNLIIEARLIGGELATRATSNEKQDSTSAVKKLADKLGVSSQIKFYGYTKDIFSALVGIPVVVLPSDSEGVPNCILEAMSLRKLVIASNTGGVSEIIEHGKTGLLHRPQDYPGLADCLEKIFNTPAGHWENMRNTALQSWQQKLTLDAMTDKLVNVYRELGLINHD